VEYKTSNSLIIKSFTGQDMIISGYASVYNIADDHNDIIINGAFAGINIHKTRFLWQHDEHNPIGIIKSAYEDSYGLKVRAVINGKIAAGKEAIALIKQGAVNALSVGFYIKAFEYSDGGNRLITKAELVEVSIVTFPANKHAQIRQIEYSNKSLAFMLIALNKLENIMNLNNRSNYDRRN